MKRRFLTLGVAALALGIAVVLYRGPGRALVRGHGGDVAATMLVFAGLGLVLRTSWSLRAGVTLAIATAIELGQALWHPAFPMVAFAAGTTFDPLDLLAYAIGVAIAVGWERRAPIPTATPCDAVRGSTQARLRRPAGPMRE